MNERIIEDLQIAANFVPVDLSAGANNGVYVSLENFNRLAVILFKTTGASGEPPTITVQQAKDALGTGAKALNFTIVWKKEGSAVNAIGQWTRVTQSAGNTFALAAGNTQALVVIEFLSDNLDTSNGFWWINAAVAKVGTTAQLGCLFYLLDDGRFPDKPENVPSALV